MEDHKSTQEMEQRELTYVPVFQMKYFFQMEKA